MSRDRGAWPSSGVVVVFTAIVWAMKCCQRLFLQRWRFGWNLEEGIDFVVASSLLELSMNLNCNTPARLCLCGRLASSRREREIGSTCVMYSMAKSNPSNHLRLIRLWLLTVPVYTHGDDSFGTSFLIVVAGRRDLANAARLPSRTQAPPANPSRISSGASNFRHSPAMGSQSTVRRPFCLRCTKPARICLCDRVKSPPLDNSVAVTILQHSLEKTHPLNSTRVARICLKNLSVVPVTDVNFQAQFLIRPLEPNRHHPHITGDAFDKSILANFSNYTVTYSSKYILVTIERTAKPDIGWILNHPVGRAAISNGFMVRKLQRKDLPQESNRFKDFEEFNLFVPPGSVLLFPGPNSMEIVELEYEIKQLIVLDGTWAKARRMYYENPWLKLLPQLKLDPRKESLYSEVRHQPKAECLSTVESIVCALKGLGNDEDALDEILQVFESMILDQRRCKDEKFKVLLKS
ncbi:hypothetical protein KSP39_PZI021444 [Platanthera zijinensis]|uniref:tRNA-uridine aminocarboxypropyltransferase n=1 Tax=Platanthera zijinensis TaxID=2320716 RepID=A0AAP0AYW3_9ASPA